MFELDGVKRIERVLAVGKLVGEERPIVDRAVGDFDNLEVGSLSKDRSLDEFMASPSASTSASAIPLSMNQTSWWPTMCSRS